MMPDLNGYETIVLRGLARAGVRYLVVGGHAVAFYGHVRPVGHLDCLIENSLDNALRVLDALDGVGAPTSSIGVDALVQPGSRIVVQPYGVDFLNVLAGIHFEVAFARATIEPAFSCRVVSIDDLIRYKRLAGRPRDLDDAQALAELRERLPRPPR